MLNMARKSLGSYRTEIAFATLAVRERVGRRDIGFSDCYHDQTAFNPGY